MIFELMNKWEKEQESASELRKSMREYVTQLCGNLAFLDEKARAGIAAHKIFELMAEEWDLAEAYREASEDRGLSDGAAVADKLQADVMQAFRLARLLLRVSEFGYEEVIG